MSSTTKYIIEMPCGVVSGVSRAHACVQYTSIGSGYEKFFASAKAAQTFIDKYADAGYGMDRADCKITAVQVPAK